MYKSRTFSNYFELEIHIILLNLRFESLIQDYS